MISVIIPTLGRPSLIRVVNSILADDITSAYSILIVSDGPEAIALTEKFHFLDPRVKKIFNPVKSGVAACLNIGMNHLSLESHFMVFSDDDFWVPGTCNIAIELSRLGGEKTIFLGDSKRHSLNFNREFKTNTKEIGDPIVFCYGNHPIFTNAHYLTLTCMLAPIGARKELFDTTLKLREDIVWLDRLFHSSYKLVQVPGFNSKVSIGYLRTVQRENIEQIKNWLPIIKSHGSKLVLNFLIFHFPRPYLKKFKLYSLLKNTLLYLFHLLIK